MKLELVLIDDLDLDPRNARKHDAKNLKAIADSLEQFGQRKPIVVWGRTVVAGNGTMVAARTLGWTQIQIARVPDSWSADQVKAYALADNRSAELAVWDEQVLAAQLLELTEAEFDIELLGFELPVDELQEVVEDEIPEQVEPKSKLGDVWHLGRHRVMCGDSTDKLSVSRLQENKEIELCFTSPPYADQRDYNGGKNLSTKFIAKFIEAVEANYYVVNLGITTKNNALDCYWNDYIETANNKGLKLLAWNIWNRQGFSGFTINQIKGMFAIEHEWIFVFGNKVKILNKTVPNKNHTEGEIKEVSVRKNDGSRRIDTIETNGFRQLGTIYSGGVERKPFGNHPATFPIDLPIEYIKAITNKNEIVYDPFGGSGTTLMACEHTNRNCLIMELDPNYVDLIIARWEKFTGQTAELIEG